MKNPGIFPTLIGNERIRDILGRDILSGRAGHAFILEAPPGSGKHTAALDAAAAFSCTGDTDERFPCGRCAVCRKIREGVSPDVYFVRRDKDHATVGVDAIRTLREDLWSAPNENTKKIYCIEEAEKLTPSAQNALLLSLEEPPPYAVFFLLTTDSSALLETVRSRAPIFRMQSFTAPEVAEYLCAESRFAALERSDPEWFAEACAACGGALGEAKRLLARSSSDGARYHALRQDAVRAVSLLFRTDSAECAQLLLSLPKEREAVLTLLSLMMLALRDLAVRKKCPDLPVQFSFAEGQNTPAGGVGLTRITAAFRRVFSAYDRIRANAGIFPTMTDLFLHTHESKGMAGVR
jgi:DNA polymerase-3 subunit delta'